MIPHGAIDWPNSSCAHQGKRLALPTSEACNGVREKKEARLVAKPSEPNELRALRRCPWPCNQPLVRKGGCARVQFIA
jgi:hypothetical protein